MNQQTRSRWCSAFVPPSQKLPGPVHQWSVPVQKLFLQLCKVVFLSRIFTMILNLLILKNANIMGSVLVSINRINENKHWFTDMFTICSNSLKIAAFSGEIWFGSWPPPLILFPPSLESRFVSGLDSSNQIRTNKILNVLQSTWLFEETCSEKEN